MIKAAHPVSSFLSASPSARVLNRVDFGFGRAATIWANEHDRITYDAPVGHTISYYLQGGTGTTRVDGGRRQGWPGALCVMPEGQSSSWEITSPFAFVHLYVPDDELRRTYSETFDRDARLFDLADVTYVDPARLERPLAAIAGGCRAGSPTAIEDVTIELCAELFADPRFGTGRSAPLVGGLAPRKLRRLHDYIEATLDQTIRLRELAELIDLSEFHLQRSFRLSCGVSPHGWIAARRIARAKALIRAGEPLSQVAVACGYAGQSHLTRAFKAGTGVAPGEYLSGRGA